MVEMTSSLLKFKMLHVNMTWSWLKEKVQHNKYIPSSTWQFEFEVIYSGKEV